jgi:nucleotide-binding universal stress UspA family protein
LTTNTIAEDAPLMKDILVHIPTERATRSVSDGSVSLAAARAAHVEAVAVGYIEIGMGYPEEAGAPVGLLLEEERRRAIERAEAALGVFETEAKNAGVSYACRTMAEIPADAANSLGALARLYDLSIVLQPEPGDFADDMISQAILFESGGPVLFLPYIFRGEMKTKRIGVCWDGSRSAARTLRDAAPFLKSADQLVTITINEDSIPAEASAEHLARKLARWGAPVRPVSLTAAKSDIQPTILSLAADENLDMLVMGGYGHSRLQERILGGVTRAMLQTMTVPVLMSH